MVVPSRIPRLIAAVVAAFCLLLTGCSTATDTTPEYIGPKFTAKVRVESIAKGVGLKVNGQLVTNQLPADVTFEVGEDGLTIRSYRVYLNRNILPAVADDRPSARVGDVIADPGTVTIDMGSPLPARIRFDGGSPVMLGTAVVDRPK